MTRYCTDHPTIPHQLCHQPRPTPPPEPNPTALETLAIAILNETERQAAADDLNTTLNHIINRRWNPTETAHQLRRIANRLNPQ
jgi:hypothetical protein